MRTEIQTSHKRQKSQNAGMSRYVAKISPKLKTDTSRIMIQLLVLVLCSAFAISNAQNASLALDPNAVLDCIIDNTTAWSQCSLPCGTGIQTRTDIVIQLPRNGGKACPFLSHVQNCNTQPCPIPCKVSDWYDTSYYPSTQSSCSKVCGGGNKDQRRDVLIPAQYNGTACPALTQIAPCSTFACNSYARYYQVYPGYDCYGNPWDLWKSDIGFIYATFQQASDACDNLVNCVGFRSSSGIGGPWWLLNTMTITDVGGPEYLCFLRTPQTMQIKQSVMNKDASWVCPLGTSTCNFNQMAGVNLPVPTNCGTYGKGTSNLCEKVLELTPAVPSKTGSVWATKGVDVSVSWNASFRFRVDNSSMSCIVDNFAQAQPFCYGRGGHGFAFVMHNDPAEWNALGRGGNGLGYTGLKNAVAIEFDSWYDAEHSEPYNNHISIQSDGTLSPLTPFQNQSLGSAVDILDFSMGAIHQVFIAYDPTFDTDMVSPITCGVTGVCNRLSVNPHTAELAQGGVFSKGFGTLRVYFDDLGIPAITVPIMLPVMLNTTVWGRPNTAIMGFTSSTGYDQYQAHHILSWQICTSSESSCRVYL